MEARQLTFFLAVVDHGGITRAAEALYVAQPSVSQTIRRLESSLGTRLFDRSGRSLVLTPAGEALVEPARQVHRDLIQARETVEEIKTLKRGRLDIMVTPDLAVDPLADFIAAFRSAHPDVWINVLEANSAEGVAQGIRDGDCEFALCAAPELVPHGLSVQILGRRQLVLVLPPAATEPQHPAGLEILGEIPLVAAPRGEIVRELIEQECEREGVTPRIQIEVELLTLHAELVMSGLGAAFLAPEVAAEVVERGALFLDSAPRLDQDVAFLYRSGTASPVTRTFVESSMKVFSERQTARELNESHLEI